MDLKSEISAELYAAVAEHYEAELFRHAITDAIQYLTDLLREKGDLDGDGASLVGQALGGNAPPIRLNPMKTQSERDEQKGFEQILRGLYIGIRNPRTHERQWKDDQATCDKIILFIDWAVAKIGHAQEHFDVDGFKDRAFDPLFVESRDYADVVVSEVPKGELVSVFREVFHDRGQGDGAKLEYLFRAMLQRMEEPEHERVMVYISEELRQANSDGDIFSIIRYLKPDLWPLLDDDVQHRTEARMIASVKVGRFDVYSGIKSGQLGTWARGFGEYFENKDELADALIELLSGGWYRQNYVGEHFIYTLPSIAEYPWDIDRCCKLLCRAALSNDAKVVRKKLPEAMRRFPDNWKEKLEEYALQYRSSDEEYYEQLMNQEDDLPF